MTDRPIIFSASMVRALLDGRKTQTRRLATSPLRRVETGDRLYVRESCRADELENGSDGVRFLADDAWVAIENSRDAADRWVELNHYRSVGDSEALGLPVPSIHVPRWASRLTLIVEEVKVERLQAISNLDAIAEGLTEYPKSAGPSAWGVCGLPPAARRVNPGNAFAQLWMSLHSKPGESWEANPFVVALTFRVERGNIDQLAGSSSCA